MKSPSLFTTIHNLEMNEMSLQNINSRHQSNERQIPPFIIYQGRERKNDGFEHEFIHKAFQPCLYVALIFGIMPMYGISGHNSSELSFRWKSLRSIISITMALIGLFLLLLAIFQQGVNSGSFGLIMFYFVSTMSMVFFIILAKNWKNIVTQWTAKNGILGMKGHKTIRQLKIITIIMGTLLLCEHALANMNIYLKNVNSPGDGLDQYFLKRFKAIFSITEYSAWKGFLLFYIHLQFTVVWNFTDIFIINIAIALGNMFKFYNKQLLTSGKQEKSIIYWKKMRELYCEIGSLVKMIDNNISSLVLLSFGSNLFFICMQLYYSLRSDSSTMKNVYFLVSFGFLLLRTLSVCLSAANMHDHSKKPLEILFATSSEQFNIEVHRLLDTIIGETPALSGYNFFTLNRNLILTVAGTIATYELVLVQFKSFNE